MRLSLTLAAALLLVGAGCSSTTKLDVDNPNNQTPEETPQNLIDLETTSTVGMPETGTKPTGTACTMDAKQCPDGSYVGRTGPNCEFAACPSKPVEKPKEEATKPTGPKTYTMAEVKAQAASGKCWTVISGKVYDLSNWINQHPGGSAPIKSLCGIDGTAKFMAMHSGDARPEATLATFFVGSLN